MRKYIVEYDVYFFFLGVAFLGVVTFVEVALLENAFCLYGLYNPSDSALFFAASAYGTNFLIGEAGIASPRLLICNMQQI